MKYFLVILFLGIICRSIPAKGLENPVLHDFERRLVRLEARQFSESENLEHRMLQLETQLGTQKGEETVESSPKYPNYYEIIKKETPSEGTTFLQRLEKVEKNWEKELEDQLAKFFSKYDSLSERFSAMEKYLEEVHTNATFNQLLKRLSKLPVHLDPEYREADLESKSIEKMSTKFQKIGSKYYFIENNQRQVWHMAYVSCKMLNANLASLQDEKEWRVLKKALLPGHNYWVGTNDIEFEGKFVSNNSGQKAPFLKWDKGEPSTSAGGADCVELRGDHNFKMNDVSCDADKYYICESANPI